MAELDFEGLKELINDLDAVASMGDDMIRPMLMAEVPIVKRAHIEAAGALSNHRASVIRSKGHEYVRKRYSPGQLRASIKETQYKNRSIEIYPQGTRNNGVRNAEVGFIWEYGAGSKGIPATGWMSQANEKCADEAVEAAAKAYDNILKTKNL